MQCSPTLPLLTRLAILRAAVPRKPIVRRLPFPAGIEVHTHEWTILRGQWARCFGVCK